MRLLSFWLGLPMFLFLLWAWWDSMHHAAATNWSYGSSFMLLWPPFEPPPQVRPSANLELPASGFSRFDSTVQDPGIGGFGFSPHYSPPLRFDDAPRSSNMTPMQPYRSIGSKAGSLWISSWITPKSLSKPIWDYRAEAQDGSWFPPLAWTHTAITRNTTAWIPYWLLSGTYTLAWTLLLFWRSRRRIRQRLTC